MATEYRKLEEKFRTLWNTFDPFMTVPGVQVSEAFKCYVRLTIVTCSGPAILRR